MKLPTKARVLLAVLSGLYIVLLLLLLRSHRSGDEQNAKDAFLRKMRTPDKAAVLHAPPKSKPFQFPTPQERVALHPSVDEQNAKDTFLRKIQTSNKTAVLRTPPTSTPFQFPTPQERVAYYMGSWYNKTVTNLDFCNSHLQVNPGKIPSDSSTLYSLDFLYARHNLPKSWLSEYLKDASNVLTHVESKVDQGKEPKKYAILHIGDSNSLDSRMPSVSKARSIPEDKKNGYKSIIWPLRLNHHFISPLQSLEEATDTPWEQKKNEIVWRGSCAGGIKNKGSAQYGVRQRFAQMFSTTHNIGIKDDCSPFRVNLSKDHSKPELNVTQQLEYKYLLSLEGNDVATGLKWKLASSSVVFMTEPSAEAYAMEGLLQSYVHYVPVKSDGSDLEDQLEWARQNDDKVKWISAQASKYMEDLWTSDQAKADNLIVKNELARIYHEQFGKSLDDCFQKSSRMQ